MPKESTKDRTRKKNPLIKARLGKPRDINLEKLPDTKTLIAEAKLDGLRGIIVKKRNGSCKAYTSNGILVPNAKYICRAVAKALKGMGFVLDGEFFCKDWNKTQSLVMTQKKHPDAKQLGIRCFDALPFNDWRMKKSLMSLRARKKFLSRIIKHIGSSRVVNHEWKEIPCSLQAITHHFKKMLKAKNEGGMYKLPDAEYPFKRDKCWLRWKPKKTIDAMVVGIKWANKGKTGKFEGLIGSLECTFKLGKKLVTFNASGMNDSVRKKLTKLWKQKQLVGKFAEFEHEGITVNSKVRFPQFVRMRKDKD